MGMGICLKLFGDTIYFEGKAVDNEVGTVLICGHRSGGIGRVSVVSSEEMWSEKKVKLCTNLGALCLVSAVLLSAA